MFSRDKLAVDIGSSQIKILLGNKQRVKFYGLIKTPEGSMADDNIIDTDAIKNALQSFLYENKIKTGQVSFAIHGQDIVMRHIEIPILAEKDIKQTVEWEMNQNLPENGNEYIIDYEIINKINEKDKKIYELLVVAAPKRKINNLVDISSSLKLKLNAIDVSANCISRVFNSMKKENNLSESIGIINIGYASSSICIIDRGRFFIDREVFLGIKNAIDEISRELLIDEHQSYTYLFEKFNINNAIASDSLDRNIQQLFERVIASFERAIQFYTNGKTKKSLDHIYLIGGGCALPAIDNYVGELLNSPVDIVDSSQKLNLKTKFPKSIDIKVYLNALGLLMRKG